MTMRNVSLTAVAALTAALAGGAMAQTATTDTNTVPLVAPGTGTPETAAPDAVAVEPTQQPATETPVAEPAPAAPEAPVQDTTTIDASRDAAPAAPATEAPAEAPAEAAPAAPAEAAPAEEAPAQQAPAEAAPAEETPTEETPAAVPAAEVPAVQEPVPGAAPEAATDAAPADAHVAQDPATAGHEPAAADAHAAHQEITDVAFSFEGPFGTYDQHQLQRGLQVYTEVCSSCHGLTYVPLRTLGDKNGPGLPDDQVRAYAANLDITDKETGEDRPRVPTDHFPTVPHVDGMGPDLSLMAKSRAGFHGPAGTGLSQLFNGIGGPEYIYSILTHYTGETKEEAGTTFYENTAFPGGWIAMPPPLMGDTVTYEDGTEATLEQESKDIAAFLMWTAEPKMMDRKQVGFVSVLFLIVLTSLLYLTNKRIWAPHKGKKHKELT